MKLTQFSPKKMADSKADRKLMQSIPGLLGQLRRPLHMKGTGALIPYFGESSNDFRRLTTWSEFFLDGRLPCPLSNSPLTL